jgi:hypothetical protein
MLTLCNTSDDLPLYIKGTTYWRASSKGFEKTHRYYITDKNPKTRHNNFIALEFIRNQRTEEDNWYILD